MKNIFSYGAGTNSTAGIISWVKKGFKLDGVVFADTGGERPETYKYVKLFSLWLTDKGFDPIVIVQNDGKYKTLERECLEKRTLPSVAFGYKSCSDKYKIRPFNKWVKKQGFGAGVSVLIGYDAGEIARVNTSKKINKQARFPLVEWGYTRDDCKHVIKEARLPQPGKSACFFCPNNRRHEILDMQKNRPDLVERAIAIENNASTARLAGLGRAWSWKDLICADDAQLKLFADVCMGTPCGCFDGS